MIISFLGLAGNRVNRVGTGSFLKRVTLLFFSFGFLGLLMDPAWGDSNRGWEIMKEAEEKMYGMNDQSAEVTFTLTDQDGRESRTELDLYWKNNKGKNGFRSKSLLVTTFPPSERGESFLLWEHTDPEKSEFWLYLPQLRQTRKIQKPSIKDALRESDLIFEDMRRIPLDRMEFKVVSEGNFQGERCFIIEAKPPAGSPYGKKLYWVSKEKKIFLKIEYYDAPGKLIKIQTIAWIRMKDQPVWKQSSVENRETRRTTEILLKNVKINSDLADRIFSHQELSKGIRRQP